MLHSDRACIGLRIDSRLLPGHRPGMFTDEPSPFKPPADSGWVVTLLVVAVFSGLGLYSYVTRVNAHNGLRTDGSHTAPRKIARDAAALPGRGDQMAAAGQRQTTIPVAPSPGFISPPIETSNVATSSARTTIYLCKSYAGGTFWSDMACGLQRATVDRMTSVPASLSFQQQVAIARGEAQEAARLYEPPQPVSAAATEFAAAPRGRPSICDVYDRQVRDLDAEARHPLPAFRQDQIRVDRMNVVTARVRDRC